MLPRNGRLLLRRFGRFPPLHSRRSNIHDDLHSTGIQKLESDVRAFKIDVKDIKSDIAWIKNNVAALDARLERTVKVQLAEHLVQQERIFSTFYGRCLFGVSFLLYSRYCSLIMLGLVFNCGLGWVVLGSAVQRGRTPRFGNSKTCHYSGWREGDHCERPEWKGWMMLTSVYMKTSSSSAIGATSSSSDDQSRAPTSKYPIDDSVPFQSFNGGKRACFQLL